jgi:DNA-binding NtrC family response regulator
MTKPPRVLAIDDDPVWLTQIPLILEDECVVDTFSTIDQGLAALESSFYDVALLDLNFDNDSRTGLDVFRHIHAIDNGTDVIVISAETNTERLIQVLNAGVTQFVPKPAKPDDIRQAVRTTLQQREIRQRVVNMAAASAGGGEESALIGNSPQAKYLRSEVDRVVRSEIKDILVTGESGTGKEVVVKLIARMADPSNRLIPIHCGAISDGLAESELFGHVKGAFTGADQERKSAFETIGGGYIFFDEIGDMPLNQQAKLLRVLQERTVQRVGSLETRKVNFRSISATNVDLKKAITEKRFREDLYYRVAKEVLHIPPLRERKEDVPELIHYFLALTPKRNRKTISNEAMALLQAYHWPGNIRQLRSVIESIQSRSTSPAIRESDVCKALPELADVSSTRTRKILIGTYGANLLEAERKRFERAIIQANGDRTKAAQLLLMSRASFFRRAKELGLVNSRIKHIESPATIP